MTAQLSHTGREPLDQIEEAFNGDRPGGVDTVLLAAIEVAAVAHAFTEVPQRNAEVSGEIPQRFNRRPFSMYMLMRVDVRGIGAGQFAKGVELPGEFLFDGGSIIER